MNAHEAGRYVLDAILRPAKDEREESLRKLRVLLAGCAAAELAERTVPLEGSSPAEPCAECRPEAERLVTLAHPDAHELEGILRGVAVEVGELAEDFWTEIEEARGFDAVSPLSPES